MEFIAKKTLAVLAPSASTDVIDFGIAAGFVRFTLSILLKSSGAENAGKGADPVSAELQYWFPGEGYKSCNPPLVVSLAPNVVSVVTREDAVPRVELVFTNGANVPDGGVVVSLSGSRTAE